MSDLDERVCPRCGEPAGEQRFCGSCGLNIWEQRELPTRMTWEADQRETGQVGPGVPPMFSAPAEMSMDEDASATSTADRQLASVPIADITSPRLRRLAADFQAIRSEYSGHPYVSVQPLGPLPPEGYRVSFRLAGLMLNGETPVATNHHVCEIRLPLGYPRDQPQVTPLTPLFHPNVADHYCIADYWAAGEGLVDVIAKLGAMIQYRIYNTRSPLNAVAAYWAEQHPEIFPVGDVELGQAELDISLGSRHAVSAVAGGTPEENGSARSDGLAIQLRFKEA